MVVGNKLDLVSVWAGVGLRGAMGEEGGRGSCGLPPAALLHSQHWNCTCRIASITGAMSGLKGREGGGTTEGVMLQVSSGFRVLQQDYGFGVLQVSSGFGVLQQDLSFGVLQVSSGLGVLQQDFGFGVLQVSSGV